MWFYNWSGVVIISNWYVIRVKTGDEEKVKTLLEDYDMSVRVLYREVYLRKQGMVYNKKVRLFPGYIFVISDLDYQEFDIEVTKIKYANGKFFKNLRWDKEGTPALLPKEIEKIRHLTGDNEVVETSIGFIEGDKVIITEGPLMGYESSIIKIDRHKRTALLELEFLGEVRETTVPLEIVLKR